MSDKKTHKYAKVIQQYFRNNKVSGIRETIAHIDYILSDGYSKGLTPKQYKLHQSLAKLIDKSKLVRGLPIKPLDSKIDSIIKRIGSKSLKNYSYIVKRIANSRVPNLSSLSEELYYLENNFSNLKLEDNYLSITTDDIVLEDINFHKFDIKISKNYFGSIQDPRVVAEALDPVYPLNGSEHPHPHIELTHLCVGNGLAAASMALLYGRFGDFFQIINSVLNTYGLTAGPYRKIQAWTGGECDDCGDDIANDELYECVDCNTVVCEGCIRYCCNCDENICLNCNTSCYSCGDYYCKDCITECGCGNAFCSDCINRCDSCGDSLCERCIVSCGHCSDLFCDNCITSCQECNKTLCEGCINTCPNCETTCCEKCLSNTCEECSDTCCENCVSACEGCGNTICSRCNCSNEGCQNE